MTDINDFTDYGEACVCGHPHRRHGNAGCSGVHRDRDTSALPEPQDDPSDVFGWPLNWPPHDSLPVIETPCGCQGFAPAAAEQLPEDYR